MIRDPLYRAILQRLEDSLDDKVFELFAVNVVRQEFPSAVPVVGGSDAGLDGAIGVLTGPRLPIITTTSDRVLDNVRRNVARYGKEWKETADGLVIVTSTFLSPIREKNVFDLVRKLGFRLVQLYQRKAIAERLYQLPRWRLELLGLPGDPPALTQLPPRIVALPTYQLVGRDDDLGWLTNTAEDRLLYGPPASGKTFLLERFARENDGYFVNSNDPAMIADGVRELQPKSLIVDDAHTRSEVLSEVVRVRSSTGAEFDIIATSWIGPHEHVRTALNLPSTHLHELSLLHRREIAEVINEIGVHRPAWLMKSLLDQADGRVGLAVTLTRMCLLGDVEDVVFGETLFRIVQTMIEEPGGLNATTLLAPFSVGGRDGLRLEDAAGVVGESVLQLQTAMARIGSAGFVLPRTPFKDIRTLSVEPADLREALVRHVFFDGVANLNIRPFLSFVVRPSEVARTLIGARRQGGKVPTTLMREWLGRCEDPEIWRSYAYLGPKEASWVLDQRPELLHHVEGALLARVPERAIPALLSIAVGDSRELHPHPEHGLRVLHDWVKAGVPGTGDGLARRRALIEGTLSWAQEDESRNEVTQHALCLALDPEFGDTTLDPVENASVTIHRGLATAEELLEILESWAEVLRFLGSRDEIKWKHLLHLLQTWIYLGGSQGVSEDVTETVRPSVQRMIDDVVSLAQEHPGVLTELHQHAALRDYKSLEPEDATYRTLFPTSNEHFANDSNGKLIATALQFGSRLATAEPGTALKKIAHYINEARIAGNAWPDYTLNVLRRISEETDDPLVWLETAIHIGFPPRYEQPFLMELLKRRLEGWPECLSTLLNDPERGVSSAAVVICFDDLPEDTTDRAIELLSGEHRLVQSMWLREKIPAGIQRQILSSRYAELSAAAAVSEWWCEERGSHNPDLSSEWREAVLKVNPSEHCLKEIFTAHPDLAEPWLETQVIAEGDRFFLPERSALSDVMRSIDISRWPTVIKSLQNRTDTWALIRELLVDDSTRYAALLDEPGLVDYHLAPLAGKPRSSWLDFVRLAIDSGYSDNKIAHAVVFGDRDVHTGPESEYLTRLLKALPDSEPDDHKIRTVIEQCRALIQEQLQLALDREQAEAVHGDDW